MSERHWWSFDDVESEMVGAIMLWRRSPGGGRWPFAGDAPWHLMQRDLAAGDYDARGGDLSSSETPLPLTPLTRAEVARRDIVSEWIGRVAERDRALIIHATAWLARGRSRIPWRRIKHDLAIRFGEGGLARRYERALAGLCQGINRGVVPAPPQPFRAERG